MLYVPDPTIPEVEFIELLKKTKMSCLNRINEKDFNRKMSSSAFEDFVEEQANLSAKGTLFEGKIKKTGVGQFPDIVAKDYLGIEVKMTAHNKWSTIGNSVSESTRVETVKRIYIFFGKFGGEFGIEFRPYAECLREITVSHNPRYQIDMTLKANETIFDKMKISYEELRQEDHPIRKIKEHYRKNVKRPGEELWWIDEPQDEIVRPVVKLFHDFKPKEKDAFRIESMILFPEIFSEKQAKFERVAAYLLENRNAISSNVRDLFTAGGVKKRKVRNKRVDLSRIFAHLYDEAKTISKTITLLDEEDINFFWGLKKSSKTKLDQWKILLDKNAVTGIKGLKASDIFEAGLGAKD